MVGLASMLAELSPLERLYSLKATPTYQWPTDELTSWTVWAPILIAVVAGVVLIHLYRRWAVQHRAAKSFATSADLLGLNADERAILTRAAAEAGLAEPDLILTAPTAFERGTLLLMSGTVATAMSAETKGRLAAAVRGLREKLGFLEAPPGGAPAHERNVPVPAGTDVTVIRPGSDEVLNATALQGGPDELVLMPATPLDVKAGEVWQLQYAAHNAQWEVETEVVEVHENSITLIYIGRPHNVNLRRFARARTCKPAHVSPFPLMKEAAHEEELPVFVAGTLTEVGGPGLRIQSPVRSTVGDRVLVVVHVGNDRVIQGVGTVRRVSQAGTSWDSAIEMTGLTDEEVGRLVIETNGAMRQAARERPPVASAGRN